MSPRRNARALIPPPKRYAASGKTRALGQHFLRDDAVSERIVSLVAPTSRDLALEIGPGEGALTGRLARSAGRLLAIEVDAALAGALMERFAAASHVEVRLADGRSFDYSALPEMKPDPGGRVLVVGNLPYSVGKPILMALVEAGRAVDEMALMLQKEVAERVAAEPGGRTYGIKPECSVSTPAWIRGGERKPFPWRSSLASPRPLRRAGSSTQVRFFAPARRGGRMTAPP